MPFTITFSPDRSQLAVEAWCDADSCYNILGEDENAEPSIVFGVPAAGDRDRTSAFFACSETCRDEIKADIVAGASGEDYGTKIDEASVLPFADFWEMVAKGAGFTQAVVDPAKMMADMEVFAGLMSRPGITKDMTVADAVAAGVIAESELP